MTEGSARVPQRAEAAPGQALDPVLLALLETPLQRESGAPPLQSQLYRRLRLAVLEGHLPAGCRVPASRALASGLEVSRNTVTAVYEQLVAEGFLTATRRGSVVAAIPQPRPTSRVEPEPRVAARLAHMTSGVVLTDAGDTLRPGVPALAQVPLAAWQRAVNRAAQASPMSSLGYGPPAGEPQLRTAIAHYFAVARGVRCRPEQIIVTEGAQQALELAARILADPGDAVWVEDPGYRGAKSAMFGADLRVIPKPVDQDGLRVDRGDWMTDRPRLVYTTPSHQYPTGAVLTVARRLALIEDAIRHDAWIIEDDYDSEFRHGMAPVPSMQGMRDGAPVIYVGTFSKTMFPSLRLGFMVLPERLMRRVETSLLDLLRGGHRTEQVAMAEFMLHGQFARHLGRMRRLYRARQLALRDALGAHVRVPHSIQGGAGGMHLTLQLPPHIDDLAVERAAASLGLAPLALSRFFLGTPSGNGLVLGYGNTRAERMDGLVRSLASAIERP